MWGLVYMIRKDVELSDKIGELFQLREGQFDPKTHLPIAERIVLGFGKTGYFLRLTDVWEYENGSRKVERESDSAGYYIITPRGRLYGSAILGFHLS